MSERLLDQRASPIGLVGLGHVGSQALESARIEPRLCAQALKRAKVRVGIAVSDGLIDHPAGCDEPRTGFGAAQSLSEHAELEKRSGLTGAVADGLVDGERFLELFAGGAVFGERDLE